MRIENQISIPSCSTQTTKRNDMNEKAWDALMDLEEKYEFMYGPNFMAVGAGLTRRDRPKCGNCGAMHTKLKEHHTPPNCVDLVKCSRRKAMKKEMGER